MPTKLGIRLSAQQVGHCDQCVKNGTRFPSGLLPRSDLHLVNAVRSGNLDEAVTQVVPPHLTPVSAFDAPCDRLFWGGVRQQHQTLGYRSR